MRGTPVCFASARNCVKECLVKIQRYSVVPVYRISNTRLYYYFLLRQKAAQTLQMQYTINKTF